MTFQPKAVIVTGGAGFVGLNLIETLLDAGIRVVSFDARHPPHRARADFDARPGFLGWSVGDVREASALRAAMAESEADAMIHAAAITAGPSRETADPDLIVSVNLGGTVAAMTAAKEMNLRRVVLLSTAAVYGETAFQLEFLEEDRPKRPRTLYAVTKSAAEDVALRLAELNGLNVTSARLGWLFGRWEHETGVRDTLSQIFEAIQAAKTGQPIHAVEDEPRDWTPAPAVAAAVVRLLTTERPDYQIYNLGSGHRSHLPEWTRALVDEFGCPVATGAATPSTGQSPGLLCGERFAAEFGPLTTRTLGEDVKAYLAWLSTDTEGTP